MRKTWAVLTSVLVLASLTAVTAPASGVDQPGLPEQTPLPSVSFSEIGRYDPGLGTLNAEIAQAQGDRLFTINTSDVSLDVVDFSDPTDPTLIDRVDLTSYGAGVTSVAVRDGLVAVAMTDDPETEPGFGVFFDTDGTFVARVTLGALPDMVTFTPNGSQALFANEGQPSDDYTVDPEGSVSLVSTTTIRQAALGGPAVVDPQRYVRSISFADFNVGGPRHAELPSGVRVFGPGASVAEDLEPEYLTVVNEKVAYVTLQENNAIAELDIKNALVKKIRALGLKDHSVAANALDPSDRDGAVKIGTWPVRGMYQPDSVANFVIDGQTFLVTANEGDARDYPGFSEQVRVGSQTLDPTAFPNAATLKANSNLGRLRMTNTSPTGPNGFTEIWSYGSRSFSIWKASNGSQVYDSGDDFEQVTAAVDPRFFNASNDNNAFDDRSDDKGPEPEGVAVGTIDGRRYAFVGLERIGGLMIYDITKRTSPTFIQYVNPRDFTVAPTATDSGPEGVQFLPASLSPVGRPLVIVSNEVSGTVSVYGLTDPDGASSLTLLLNNDGESALLPQTSGGMSVAGVSAFKSVLDREARDARGEGNAVVSVYAGDAFLPSALLTCSLPPNPASTPVYDAVAQRQIPYDAHAIGNHEFDVGPDFTARFIRDHTTNGVLTQPFLTANVDFTPSSAFASLLDADGLILGYSSDGRVVASSKIVVDEMTGERFGLVGASPPDTESISSPAPVRMKATDIPGTAALVQSEVDRLQGLGIDKIVLVSQLQGVDFDRELLALTAGIDVAVAGGGEELLLNPDVPDAAELLPGESESSDGTFPLTQIDGGGRTVYIVTTTGQYRYLGRLDVEFDGAGEVTSVDTPDSYIRRVIPKTAQSDAAGITDSVPLDPGIETTVITPVNACLAALNSPLLRTEVVLDTSRGSYNPTTLAQSPGNRRTETNTGNSVADAYLRAYDVYGPAAGLPARGPANPVIAFQNGGGIRDQGGPVMPPGGVVPGTLSRKNTLDVLTFFTNKTAVLTDVTPAVLKSTFERAAAGLPAADGGFLQVAGLDVVYDVSGTRQVLNTDGSVATPGTRVVSITLDDGTPIVSEGGVVSGAPDVDVVSQNFTLFQGGDGYYQLQAVDPSHRVLLPPTYEQAWVEYLLTFPVEAGYPTIDSTDLRYAPGGEGRITIVYPPVAP